MTMRKDKLAIRSECIWALGTTFTNAGLLLIGYALLRPMVELGRLINGASVTCAIIGVALIVSQH